MWLFLGYGGFVENGDENKYRLIRQLGLYTTIPLLLLSGPAAGYIIGNYLDERFGTKPWLMVSFLILGFIASIRQTIQIITRAGQNQK